MPPSSSVSFSHFTDDGDAVLSASDVLERLDIKAMPAVVCVRAPPTIDGEEVSVEHMLSHHISSLPFGEDGMVDVTLTKIEEDNGVLWASVEVPYATEDDPTESQTRVVRVPCDNLLAATPKEAPSQHPVSADLVYPLRPYNFDPIQQLFFQHAFHYMLTWYHMVSFQSVQGVEVRLMSEEGTLPLMFTVVTTRFFKTCDLFFVPHGGTLPEKCKEDPKTLHPAHVSSVRGEATALLSTKARGEAA